MSGAAHRRGAAHRQCRPIGILGGTFDPIHHGHVRIAEAVAEALALSCVRLVPAARPPHRERPAVEARHRLAMVRLAVADTDRLCVDDRELRRPGPSYSVETMAQLRAAVGETPLVLIMGADAFARLTTWRRWQALFSLTHIAVCARPGSPVQPVDAALRAEYARRVCRDADVWRAAPGGMIVPVRGPRLGISATHIRARLAAGADVRGLLPDAVLDYIRAKQLYIGR